MLCPMPAPLTPHPTGKPRTYRGRRKLLTLIEALRPLGLNATIPELASALAPMQEGKWGLRISREMLDSILRDVEHQALINAVLIDGFKAHGYETTYRDLYPAYREKCEALGVRALSLKTFCNRALREPRWERAVRAGNHA